MKSIINSFKNLDKLTYSIMKFGLKVCFGICIFSSIILLTYETIYFSPNLYYIGLSLFKLGLIFGIEFVVCGIIVDSIKKNLI
jgi:hypothetical protein